MKKRGYELKRREFGIYSVYLNGELLEYSDSYDEKHSVDFGWADREPAKAVVDELNTLNGILAKQMAILRSMNERDLTDVERVFFNNLCSEMGVVKNG